MHLLERKSRFGFRVTVDAGAVRNDLVQQVETEIY